MMTRIGRERGWPAMTREQFDAMRAPDGALLRRQPAGGGREDPAQHEIFGHDRFLAQMSVGTMPHRDVMRAIELLGGEVAPAVRAALAPAGGPPA